MKLSLEQLGRLNRLLDQALELDQAGRLLLLETLPAEDRDLKEPLSEALFRDLEVDLDGLAALAAQHLAGEDNPLKGGDRIGPYALGRQLGAGGMAQVWLARRADGVLKREVALKLPSSLKLRGDLAARFDREKDILAALEHPHIARLYDAGVAQDGLPYLAMEYVDGRPIDAWCDARRSTVRERVTLFLQVLEAVEYAHRRGVLHRDIKPSNVLVTGEGQVRLLDFGVARLLEQTDTKLTQVYGKALTPAYASPEQKNDEQMGLASDVYSLGVLLYELLCGSLPEKEGDATAAPSTRVDGFAAGSRNATVVQIARQLIGELDAVVMKALASDPARRYASADELALDLTAWLAGRPVLALPASPGRRLAKFVRRDPMAALAAFAVLIALGLGINSLHNTAPPPAPAEANAAAVNEKSIAVLAFSDMSEKHDQEFFSDGLAAELLDLLERIPGLHVAARTSSFYFKGKQATVEEIGKALHVAHVLDGSVRRSGNRLRVTTELIRCRDGQNLWSQTYERTLDDVFKVQDEITDAVASALKIQFGTQRRAEPYRPTNREAYLQYLIGQHYIRSGNRTENPRRAYEALKNAIAIDPRYAAAYSALSSAEILLADVANDPTGYKRAVELAHRAIELDPQDSEAYHTLGDILGNVEWKWNLAITNFDKAIDLDPERASGYLGRAEIELAVGRISEALADNEKATILDPLDANSWTNYGQALTAADRWVEARSAFEVGLALDRKNSYLLYNFAILDLLERRFTEARVKCRELNSDDSFQLICEAMAQHSLGHESDALSALSKLESRYSREAAYQIAEVHAWRHEKKLAFRWLDRAIVQIDGGLDTLATDPILRELHSDPRFKEMLHSINVVQ